MLMFLYNILPSHLKVNITRHSIEGPITKKKGLFNYSSFDLWLIKKRPVVDTLAKSLILYTFLSFPN